MTRAPSRLQLARAASEKLREVGVLLSDARLRRDMSVSELARRVGVDRRTIAQLEAGSPRVALGTFFQALEILGLLRGIDQVVSADNDLEAIAADVRRARSRRRRGPTIPDAKVEF